jgi:preprotein translocase subunit SecA
MSELTLRGPASRLAEGPYAERADVKENALDRWLAAGYARLLAPWRNRRPGWERFADQVERYGTALAQSTPAELHSTGARLARGLRRQGLQEEFVAEAFALIREWSDRLIGLRPYRVQLLGGLALLRGQIAEMDTGEGKTLAATLPAGVAALAGIPVHIVTVNDYLAARDGQQMGPLFAALGLTVGVVQHGQSPAERRAAYAADITYCTNKELGFDYLRDRIQLQDWPSAARLTLSRRLQGADRGDGLRLRGLHFAIVDEADSILIDEARTPLIIANPAAAADSETVFGKALAVAAHLQAGADFVLVRNEHRVQLTPRGEARLRATGSEWPGLLATVRGRFELITQALAALHLYQRDKHYLVQDNAVQIVDEFTGRLMPDRSWERGLHQLIEFKEGCELTGQRETLASITYQRFFRRYLHLAGMTGTAREVAGELWAVYRLRISTIPPHRPVQRRGLSPWLLPAADRKWTAVVQAIRAEAGEKGRPVLVGTRSVAASEQLSARLTAAGIPHQVLNARQDADEAGLIAAAGQAGKVTVATNMAGRGTDIKLGSGIAAAGGLHVILTEFHEAGRIDRQLFGRCGRQGDPGTFQAVVALDDELFRVYGSAWLRWLASAFPATPGLARWLRWRAQARAERHHARVRRQTLERDQRVDRLLAFSGRH